VEVSGPVNDLPSDGHSANPSADHRAGSLLSTATLPCGADVDLLLEQVAAGLGHDLDAHQRGCVHCQAAIVELTGLWGPVTELAAGPVPAPPGLTAGVMSQIRNRVRDIWYTLEATEIGVIRIAARIVATLARDSARMIPGVRVALGRSTRGDIATLTERATFGHQHPHAAVGVLGRTAVVDLALAVSYGVPVHDVAREVQRHVIATLRQQVGLQNVAVNVTVDDVLDDPHR
jgi:uncharacterized alkaline shock family protein YloU